MNYNKAIEWCQKNPLKVMESNTRIMYYTYTSDENKPYNSSRKKNGKKSSYSSR